MKSKIVKTITIFIISILGLSLLNITPIAHAANDVCSSNAAEAVKEAAGCNGSKDALPGIIINILNGIIAVSGLIAVIFVVIGGINYMTSAGDSNKLEKAKKTILYACIGMIVAVLSFAIVNFTITNIIGGQSSSQESSEEEDDDNEDSNTQNNKKPTNAETK